MEANEIDKARLDIERERLELEKSKAEIDKKFLRANSGVLISAAVSLAAVIVSLSQVWVTKISKDKELEIVTIQKMSELEIQDKQKERELAAQNAQKKREWDLNAAKFITDNRKAIFTGTPAEQRLFAKIIGSIYPPDLSSSLLERIEKASPTASKQTWREVRSAIQHPHSEAGKAAEGIRAYQDALELKPDSEELHNKLGDAYYHAGQMSEAIASYTRAAALNPYNADAFYNLAIAYLEGGNEILALSSAKILRQLDAKRYYKFISLLRECRPTFDSSCVGLKRRG